MKTVKQWLEELPEPIRTRAFENNRLQGNEKYLQDNIRSLKASVGIAFRWSDTVEGGDYWKNIASGNKYTIPTLKVKQDMFERFNKLLTKNIFVEVKPIDDWNNWTWLIFAKDAMQPICIIEKANPEKVYTSYFEAMEAGINCAENL